MAVRSQQRTIILSLLRPSHAACVVGTKCMLDIQGSIPPGADSFTVHASPGVHVSIIYNPEKMRPGQMSNWPLNKGAEIMVSTVVPSDHLNDNKVKVSFHKENGRVLMGSARLYLTSVAISLHADTRRDGTVNMKNTNKLSWTWGPYGHGAILLVNCDKDQPDSKDMDNEDEGIFTSKDLEDMSILILKTQGPKAFFKTHGLLLHVSPPDSEKLGVFHQTETNSGSEFRHVLGREKLFYHVEYNGEREHVFYVEGLTFPDADFSGLLSISATLLEVSEEGQQFVDMSRWVQPSRRAPPQLRSCSSANRRQHERSKGRVMRALQRPASTACYRPGGRVSEKHLICWKCVRRPFRTMAHEEVLREARNASGIYL